MQFITVIIIRHANDINDSIELKLKFNGIEIDEPEIATKKIKSLYKRINVSTITITMQNNYKLIVQQKRMYEII